MSEAHVVVGLYLLVALATTVLLARMAMGLNHHRPAPPRLVPPRDDRERR